MTLPIGRRVARWRVRRSMTQQMLADRLGKSKSWVDKVERGRPRPGPVLGDPGDRRRAAGRPGGAARPAGRRRRPARWTGWTGSGPRSPATTLRGRRGADGGRADDGRSAHAWLTYQHAHYAQLVRVLPGLLDAAQRHATRPRRGELLVQAYRITSSVLVKLGEADLGWLAADRAMAVAGDDPEPGGGRRPSRSGRRCARSGRGRLAHRR